MTPADGGTWPQSRDAIAARIPHQGRMCLLDAVRSCTPARIVCVAHSHRAPDHPLRSASGLLAPVAIEYAAQACALHGALCAQQGVRGRPGFLVSARGVRLHVPRLDDTPGALVITVDALATAERQASIAFALHDEAGRLLVDGRAAVVLDTPLVPAP